jgi:uncharacterized protein
VPPLGGVFVDVYDAHSLRLARPRQLVEDPETKYASDFDLLAVVATDKIAADVSLWHEMERRAREVAGKTPVTLIVHDIKFVNHEIRMGQYFFADVVNEGVLLFNSRHVQLAKPKAPS